MVIILGSNTPKYQTWTGKVIEKKGKSSNNQSSSRLTQMKNTRKTLNSTNSDYVNRGKNKLLIKFLRKQVRIGKISRVETISKFKHTTETR